MASNFGKEDADLIIQRLMPALQRLGISSSNKGNSSSNSDVQDIKNSVSDLKKSIKKTNKDFQDLSDTLGDLIDTSAYSSEILKDGRKESEAYVETLAKANRSIFMSAAVTDRLSNTLSKFGNDTVKKTSGVLTSGLQRVEDLTSSVAKAMRSSSMFNASLIKGGSNIEHGSESYFKMMTKLDKASSPLNSGMLKAAGAWNEQTNSLKNDLSSDTFAHIRLALGQVQSTMVEQMANLKIKNMGDVIKQAEGNIQQMFSGEASKDLKNGILGLAAKLSATGVDLGLVNSKNEPVSLVNRDAKTGNVTGINDAGFKEVSADPALMEQLVKTLQALEVQNTASIKEFDSATREGVHGLHALIAELGLSIPILGRFKGGLIGTLEAFAGLGLLGKGIGMLKDSIKSIYGQVEGFNIAQIPQTFGSVKASAINMGMSFEDTVKFMQENKRQVALYGNGFAGYLTGLKGTFAQFGYNMAQASAIVGPASAMAAASGVNVRDSKAMNSAMSDAMRSYQRISGIVDISAEDYMKSTASMLSSSEVQYNILGMGAKGGKVFADQLVATRDRFVQLGMSIDQANDLIKAQNEMVHASATSKITDASHLMMRAQLAGMSGAQGNELRQFAMSTHPDQLPGGTAEYVKLLGQLKEKEGNQFAKNSDTQNYIQTSYLGSLGLSSQVETLMNGGQTEAMAKLNKTAMSGKEAGAAGKTAQGSQSIANFGNTINSVSQFLNNNFLKALEGVALALAGLGIEAFLVAHRLGTLGSLGKLGGGKSGIMDMLFDKTLGKTKIGSKIGSFLGFGEEAIASAGPEVGMLGKLGKFGGGLLRGAGGGLVGALGGMALDAGGSALINNGHKTSGGLLSALGSAANGAGTGALIGSIFGPIGTGIGAALGGTIGGIKGVADNWTNIVGDSQHQAKLMHDVSNTLSNVSNGFVGILKMIVPTIGGFLTGFANYIKPSMLALTGSIGFVLKLFGTLGDGMVGFIRSILDKIPGGFGKALEGMLPAPGALSKGANAIAAAGQDFITTLGTPGNPNVKTNPGAVNNPKVGHDKETTGEVNKSGHPSAVAGSVVPAEAVSGSNQTLQEIAEYMATAVKLLEIIAQENPEGANRVVDMEKANRYDMGDSLRSKISPFRAPLAHSYITGRQ